MWKMREAYFSCCEKSVGLRLQQPLQVCTLKENSLVVPQTSDLRISTFENVYTGIKIMWVSCLLSEEMEVAGCRF
jgi:hypothetical protein